MSWSLAAVESGRGAEVAARDSAGAFYRIAVLPAGISLIDVFRRWAEFADLLRSWTPAGAEPMEVSRMLQPLRFPNKLLCVGVNYRDHRKEMSGEVEAVKATPFFFMKPPTTALVGPDEDILVGDFADRLDWEAEIAIVIGKRGRFISRDQALDHIAGVTLANDISARGQHHRPNAVAPAFEYDWIASKAQDGFCPLGPSIVPVWLIPDLGDIAFQLTLNGEIQQSSNTRYMVTDIPGQVEAISRYITLEQGDVILTGTPAGVGAPRGLCLKDGDVLEVSAPSIGVLRNTLRPLARS